MPSDPLFVLVVLAVLAVVVILMLGIGGFAKGGETNRKYGNKMMRYRLIAQFIAVLLICLYVYLRGTGGQ
ncbi:hypothetical protein SuNHUV7_07990 (plasmid) [Pseudoseohaeicola sp. NH-UV-7]|jgi:uncharacterized membrane protein affecting hemolysin expression|uniref:twin transmembrane helix small protein n=1 Tax=unclassified Sulfitobacter TaxID=196795 RepID=UPI000E0A97F1|nr:twin transmembrane helix small protein [Sulfitobacter sp. JL08]AXI53464.1 twin transmembrane helix small protein [Sulfitobacter sp. JL08]